MLLLDNRCEIAFTYILKHFWDKILKCSRIRFRPFLISIQSNILRIPIINFFTSDRIHFLVSFFLIILFKSSFISHLKDIIFNIISENKLLLFLNFLISDRFLFYLNVSIFLFIFLFQRLAFRFFLPLIQWRHLRIHDCYFIFLSCFPSSCVFRYDIWLR